MQYIISHLSKIVAGLQPKTITFLKLFLILLLLGPWQVAEAAPALSRSPAADPPTVQVKVNGSGFSAYEAVDIYFDTEDLCLSATRCSGKLVPVSLWPSASGL